MIDKTIQKQIADTILEQMGGRKFIAMTGANTFGFCANEAGNVYLGFKYPNGRNPKTKEANNYMRITLADDDTYTVEVGYIRGYKYTVRETLEGVYCDMLQATFTEKTGLDTRLF